MWKLPIFAAGKIARFAVYQPGGSQSPYSYYSFAWGTEWNLIHREFSESVYLSGCSLYFTHLNIWSLAAHQWSTIMENKERKKNRRRLPPYPSLFYKYRIILNISKENDYETHVVFLLPRIILTVFGWPHTTTKPRLNYVCSR